MWKRSKKSRGARGDRGLLDKEIFSINRIGSYMNLYRMSQYTQGRQVSAIDGYLELKGEVEMISTCKWKFGFSKRVLQGKQTTLKDRPFLNRKWPTEHELNCILGISCLVML